MTESDYNADEYKLIIIKDVFKVIERKLVKANVKSISIGRFLSLVNNRLASKPYHYDVFFGHKHRNPLFSQDYIKNCLLHHEFENFYLSFFGYFKLKKYEVFCLNTVQ
jgi:hypothetical protein